jgi:hypothetical protein
METFTQEKTAFNMVKEMVQQLLNQLGFQVYSKIKHPDGNIKLTNFMTLLQKLTAMIYKTILRNFFDQDPDDPENKTRSEQRRLKARLSEGGEGNSLYVIALIDANGVAIYERIIPGIVRQIDGLTMELKPDDGSEPFRTYRNIRDQGVIDLKAAAVAEAPAPVYLNKDQMANLVRQANRRAFRGAEPRRRRVFEDYSGSIETPWGNPKNITPWGDRGGSSSSSSSSSKPFGRSPYVKRSSLATSSMPKEEEPDE